MKKTLLPKNENGSVVVLALVMVVLLSLLGMAVTRTSSIDVQVASNEGQATQDLYQAESADSYALETTSNWLTDGFLAADTAASDKRNVDLDGGGDDATVEIRCITITPTTIAGFSNEANSLPLMQHIAPSPIASASSLGKFVVRRYGITSKSLKSNTQVQIGVYKFFNKF
jgi:Tfp pilus assembly protein PilX